MSESHDACVAAEARQAHNPPDPSSRRRSLDRLRAEFTRSAWSSLFAPTQIGHQRTMPTIARWNHQTFVSPSISGMPSRCFFRKFPITWHRLPHNPPPGRPLPTSSATQCNHDSTNNDLAPGLPLPFHRAQSPLPPRLFLLQLSDPRFQLFDVWIFLLLLLWFIARHFCFIHHQNPSIFLNWLSLRYNHESNGTSLFFTNIGAHLCSRVSLLRAQWVPPLNPVRPLGPERGSTA